MSKGTFGKNLKFYRQTMGLTQKKLGEKSGVSQVNIANYERGTRFPGEETLFNISKNLGVSLELLFGKGLTEIEKGHESNFSIDAFLDLILTGSMRSCSSYLYGWKQTMNYSLEECYSNILIPVLSETGSRWERGELSISEEHVISSKIRELITYSGLEEHPDETAKRRENVWMGFCAPSDKHDLVLLMLSNLMKARGWTSFFIGTDVPLNDLLLMIKKYKPTVLSVSISMAVLQNGLEAYLEVLEAKNRKQIPVIAGGRGARSLKGLKDDSSVIVTDSLKEAFTEVLKYEKS